MSAFVGREAERRDVQAAAQSIGHQLIMFDVSSDRESRQPLRPSSNVGLVRYSSAPARSLLRN